MRKRAKKKHHRQFIFFSASGLIAVIVCIMLNVQVLRSSREIHFGTLLKRQ